MIIYPAIDLKDGKVVRLLQGRMEDATIYSDDPAEMAAKFMEEGSRYLHIVDLNGAFEGKPVNDDVIRDIVRRVPMNIQIGGGIRTLARIEELLDLGVSRVILGTVAVRDPELVEEAVRRYGDQIIVGIDARNGMVAVQGWAESTDLKAEELGKAMKEVGVSRIVFTDISRDGMLAGPNIASSVRMAEATGLKVIVSGGISVLDDLKRLKSEADKGTAIDGAIVGKAIYSGAFTLEEALRVID
ncbi:1-(5-phosphoribosyl)-5-[(5-phosphoribosylamino)methylideneamino]imidazole-4-carboxamide isomerase [Dehalobacter sp. DCM]|uniref:1-(5-phosphoribosyl)-5-[(5- phosphoribosylamino)methylideneamino]imidazole-4- carboxamide isomerase n=1 Tax=Dehalobacter sp. DCM TaxID=2907827 RepID=UPI003081E3EE|nr:1-(5-phosphoribosyl)-5-[(5-phosphoribosylamino)methylideneamino]imidazole-4-carboxamide isomerase [Dehalobacter sp. DCM]